MSRVINLRALAAIAALTFAWCALWGSASPANLLTGLLVSVISIAAVGWQRRKGPIRIGPLIHFGVLVLWDLVVSTLAVAREILTPTDSTEEAIVAVEVPRESRAHLLLIVVAVTLTPGTAVVDSDGDTGVLYLHLLHEDRRASTVRHVSRLAELACAALPTSGAGLANRGPAK